MNNSSLVSFIENIPKVELHLHIEGTFEPELIFEIAKRNNLKLRYNSVDELKASYNFNNLQEFLDVYYTGIKVLQTEKDFYDLTWAYLNKVKSQNVIHTEIMFDPQSHTDRGIKFDTIINGIYKALQDAENQFGITSKLIMSFLRHLSQESAIETYQNYKMHKDKIDLIGLDSSELGNPPSKFVDLYKMAKSDGLLLTAHAGEEGPAGYVWEALDILKVDRIDHGNHSLDDDKLVKRIVNKNIALTVCPLSNFKLKVVKDLNKHPLRTMLEKGILATVNSDDPAYFGGYINENFLQISKALNFTKSDIVQLVRNSIEASCANEERNIAMIKILDEFIKE